MLIEPAPLSIQRLPQEEADEDKRNCKRFGPCGVGEKALFLNSFYFERRYYIPYSSIERVYKRVAMSKGGFTGKGIFGSMPYLVVQYEGGAEKQCNFKHEEQVDQLLAYLGRVHPEIPLHSEKAEKRLAEAEAERRSRLLPELPEDAEAGIAAFQEAIDYLEKRPDLSEELSRSARRQRAQSISKPVWRYVAAFILLLGLGAAAFGAWELVTKRGDFGLYFLLFGLAAVFLFSGVSVGPTARNNKKKVAARYANAKTAVEDYVADYPARFPVPARYAHPVVLRRMQRALQTGDAKRPDEALEAVKRGLKALNASVTVDQTEYEEVVAIKALFLNEDYR